MRERYLVRNERAAWRVYEGEAVILSPEDSVLHTLNAAGTVVWTAADGATSWSETVGRVARAFGRRPAEIEAALDAFVTDLEARGLVTTLEHPGPIADIATAAAEPHPEAPRPWEEPRLLSETVFETTALACAKLPAGGGKCNVFAKLS